MKGQKRKTSLILVKVFIVAVILGSLCHYVTGSSFNINTYASVMMSSRNVSVSTGTSLFATDFKAPMAVVSVESEKVETATIETEAQLEINNTPDVTKKPKSANKNKPKKTELVCKFKKVYITIEGYRKKMNIHMDISQPSGLSKEDFMLLAERISKKLPGKDPQGIFKKMASFIWHLGQKYQVDEVALLSIMAHESDWCSYDLAIKRKNFTGQSNIEGKLITYRTVQENLEKTAKNLRKNYLKNRKNLLSINKKYCEPVDGEYTWYIGVYGCMKKIVSK